MDCLSLLFGDFQRARKQFLFLEAEELIVSQFVLTATGTLQESKMKSHNILFVRIDPVENRRKIVKRVVVAHHHQDISRSDTQSLGCEIVAGFQIELIQLRVLCRLLACRPFGYRKYSEENECKTDAGDR